MLPFRLQALLLLLVAMAGGSVHADEAAIRRNLPVRLPQLPAIDEVRRSPMKGLWEVRLGTEIVYTDDQAQFVIEGDLLDTQRQINLTQQREAVIKAIDVHRLPLQDSVTWRRGTGARMLVVFADPNCGYCRQLERQLSDATDITVYTFMIPILGEDSIAKAQAIWCAADRGRTWRSWMVDGIAPPAAASCDTAALDRNLALQRRHGVIGTPSLVFADGERVSGVLPLDALEKKFASLAHLP
jgi:thiol:disulfide interchange protein DsbC